jgi:hypothetical protein
LQYFFSQKYVLKFQNHSNGMEYGKYGVGPLLKAADYGDGSEGIALDNLNLITR